MRKAVNISPYDGYNCRCTLAVPIESDKVLESIKAMNEVSIISACPKCGGMPIVRQHEEITIFGASVYDVMCEDCHDYSCVAYSPEMAIKEWEAHCKQKTRSREDA